jgi:hypothetical protein
MSELEALARLGVSVATSEAVERQIQQEVGSPFFLFPLFGGRFVG